MGIGKRVFVFIAVNLAVIAVISVVVSALGIQPYLTARGLNYTALLELCAVWGFGGAFISLQMSRWIAKRAMGVVLLDPRHPSSDAEHELISRVEALCQRAGLTTLPEIGVYRSPEVNAFATGPSKRRALLAVSTGLLATMDGTAVDAVLGHELSHVANGDMVTMTLVQGVVNTFVMFLARVLAFAVESAMQSRRDERGGGIGGLFHLVIVIGLETVLMFIASPIVYWVSRAREYRADAGSARLTSREAMIHALESLKARRVATTTAAPALATMMIQGESRGLWARLYSSHPPLEKRIAALRAQGGGTP